MYLFPHAILSVHLFFLFSFLYFCSRNFYFFFIFVLEFLFSFSSSELVLSGDWFSGDLGAFVRDFFLSRVTWVYPSSSLLMGWSPVSVLCVFVVAGVVAGIVAFEVGVVFFIVVVVVVSIVDAEDAITVVFLLLVVFWRQDLEKWPSCLQCQHCGLLPSSLGPCNRVCRVLLETPLFRHTVKE